MNLLKKLKSNTFRDFFSLLFSSLFQKFLGLIREIIIAFLFGSSLFYANFLVLQSIAGLFSQFTIGNSLKSNLLPKFTKIFKMHKEISLKKVLSFSMKSMIFLFVLSQLIQFLIIWYLDSDYSKYLLVISIFLSITICINFHNTIYLTILQSQGRFIKFSLATTLNEFIVVMFVYPLSLILGVFGLVISRVIGVMSITVSYIIPMNRRKEGYELELSTKDFNVPTLILGNFANILILSSRFISGTDGSNSITYFTYSVFILNALLTAVIGNISTLLLRNVSIKKNSAFMFYSLLVSILLGFILVIGLQYFAVDLIKLIFMRGQFNLEDVMNTAKFIKNLSYAFVLIFISTTLFQPFFSLSIESSRKERRNYSIIFISTIILGLIFSLFTNYSVEIESLIVIYSGSLVSLILSFISYSYYLKKNK